jgi:rhodanese-related sulfurtransferase/rubrerythrin
MQMIPEMNAEQVRKHISDHPLETFNLIDVRQPSEFETGHIPGAELCPVNELSDELERFDREKPTIVYCRRGARGQAAVAVLMGAGFKDVHNLTGGIDAYNGQTVDGLPETGESWFADATTIGEMVARAWQFEEGARRFYEAAAEETDEEAAKMFRGLARAEVNHKEALEDLGPELAGDDFKLPEDTDLMEGGAKLDEALSWIKGRDAKDIMEYALALETIAYDRYVQLARRAENDKAQRLFQLLADGEQLHLRQIIKVFEPRMKR